MNIRGFTLALVLCASVLVACRNGPGLTPGALTAALPANMGRVGSPDITAFCTKVTPVNVPGKYIIFGSDGKLVGSKFTGAGGWSLDQYAYGKPGPTPTPHVSPTPWKVAAWLYYGTYKLTKHKSTGCAILLVTKSGKPFPGINPNHDSAIGGGFVVLKTKKPYTFKFTEAGPASVSIDDISPTSGSGIAKLTTLTGAAYDTASIKLMGQISF